MRSERAFKMRRSFAALIALLMALTVPACAVREEFTAEATGGSMVLTAASDDDAFSDVSDDAWYGDDVSFVRERDLMNGVGSGRFAPDDTFTRAQMATVLYRIAGEPSVSTGDSFTDVAPGAWYAASAAWAKRTGVINGVGDGGFAPDMPVTQEMLVTMLWRMAKEPYAEAALDASGYAATAVGWARARNIAPATKDYTFSPRENASRAQVAALLHNYLTREETPTMNEIMLTVSGKQLTVEWADNASVDALRELLKKGPLSVELSRYGGFEQVGALGTSLPRSDEQTTTEPGDIVLYSGNQIVMFYGSNSWAYTRLGKITGMSGEELTDLLDAGGVTATLSLAEGSANGAARSPGTSLRARGTWTVRANPCPTHRFVASAMAVKYAHEHYPQFQMGNMDCFITSYPMTCNPDDLVSIKHRRARRMARHSHKRRLL